MKESILNGKSMLAVNDEPDILAFFERKIHEACSPSAFDRATTFYEASQFLASHTYDLVILDITGVRGFDLLERAVLKKVPVAIITARPITPQALCRSFDFKIKAMAYLPREKLDEIVPFVETFLEQKYIPFWKHFINRLKRIFDSNVESNRKYEIGLQWEKWGIFFRG